RQHKELSSLGKSSCAAARPSVASSRQCLSLETALALGGGTSPARGARPRQCLNLERLLRLAACARRQPVPRPGEAAVPRPREVAASRRLCEAAAQVELVPRPREGCEAQPRSR
ncbi:hypothetical protein Salat_1674100, partial [Sesamum alatum]